MRRFVSVLVHFAILIYVTVDSTKLTIEKCQEMAGVSPKSVEEIQESLKTNPTEENIYRLSCYVACRSAMAPPFPPVPLFDEDGTPNVVLFYKMLESLKKEEEDYRSMLPEIFIQKLPEFEITLEVSKLCIPKGNFCDRVATFFTCVYQNRGVQSVADFIPLESQPITITEE